MYNICLNSRFLNLIFFSLSFLCVLSKSTLVLSREYASPTLEIPRTHNTELRKDSDELDRYNAPSAKKITPLPEVSVNLISSETENFLRDYEHIVLPTVVTVEKGGKIHHKLYISAPTLNGDDIKKTSITRGIDLEKYVQDKRKAQFIPIGSKAIWILFDEYRQIHICVTTYDDHHESSGLNATIFLPDTHPIRIYSGESTGYFKTFIPEYRESFNNLFFGGIATIYEIDGRWVVVRRTTSGEWIVQNFKEYLESRASIYELNLDVFIQSLMDLPQAGNGERQIPRPKATPKYKSRIPRPSQTSTQPQPTRNNVDSSNEVKGSDTNKPSSVTALLPSSSSAAQTPVPYKRKPDPDTEALIKSCKKMKLNDESSNWPVKTYSRRNTPENKTTSNQRTPFDFGRVAVKPNYAFGSSIQYQEPPKDDSFATLFRFHSSHFRNTPISKPRVSKPRVHNTLAKMEASQAKNEPMKPSRQMAAPANIQTLTHRKTNTRAQKKPTKEQQPRWR